jgi:hypothetical protein
VQRDPEEPADVDGLKKWILQMAWMVLETDFQSINTEMVNKMQQYIIIYYSMFIKGSTCFGWHTSHHQELTTVQAAYGFAYMKGGWTLWLLDASSNHNHTVASCWPFLYELYYDAQILK